MSFAIISANYGGVDTVKEVVEQTVPVAEWLYVTDDYQTGLEAQSKGWTMVFEQRHHMAPCLAAKVPKFRPDMYTGCYDRLWIDASFYFTPTMAEQALRGLETSCISLFPHPHRDNIKDEVTVSRTLTKYDGQRMESQIGHYLALDYPDNQLWATGVLATSARLPTQFGSDWLAECVRWTYQDQLSFPYIAWEWDIAPSRIDENQFTSAHFKLGAHK